MKIERSSLYLLGAATVAVALVLFTGDAEAHCDGMDGPVVKAAQRALETGDVDLALVWVGDADEPAVRAVFGETLAVRSLSPRAKELADLYFFETLVRLHRAGEGAAYTGLKPAGRDLGPAIPAADRALETGDVEGLVQLVTAAASEGIRERFQRVRGLASYDPKDLRAGRAYIQAYVSFVHYTEGCYQATQSAAHGHATDANGHSEHDDSH